MRIGPALLGGIVLGLFALSATPSAAQTACLRWNLGDHFSLAQSNSNDVVFYLQRTGIVQLTGKATSWHIGFVREAEAEGKISGDDFDVTVYWDNQTVGRYTGQIGAAGRMEGTTYNKAKPESRASWFSRERFTCLARAGTSQGRGFPSPLGKRPPPIELGRVKSMPGTKPSAPPLSLCDAARSARARNSPAAPGLERQCTEQQGREAAGAPAASALALRGEAIAAQSALSAELRNLQPEGPARRGFDVGMAAAENQTAPGPGKDRIRATLPPGEQAGFDVAVSFSLDRNRHAALAAVGAAIAEADPVVAEARGAELDPRFWLGFDIASGLFGDPALGAQGNTATGPGSLGIRDGLNPVSQRGFNSAVTLHLARTY